MEITNILSLPKPYPSKCYCWGSGSGGTLSVDNNGNIRKISLQPFEIKLPSSDPVVSIAASDRRTVVTTHSGACFSWGKPPLGRKTTSLLAEAKPKKLQIQDNVDVEKVNLGEKHGVILTRNGNILSFGDAADGKLGLQNKTRGQVLLPTKVLLKEKCIDVACGFASTTVLISDGFEGLTYGTAGLSKDVRTMTKLPQRFLFPVKFVNLSSGTSHFAAISSNGQSYTWGLSANGRLGHGENVGFENDCIISHPLCIEYFVNNNISIKKSFCGGAHTVMLDEEGKIYSFGWNKYYQCGTKHNNDIFMPTKISIQCNKSSCIIVEMSCGFAHTTAIDALGDLYVWGFNEEGQLGLGHEENVKEPTLLDFGNSDFTIAVSAGKTHTVCLRSQYSISKFMDQINEIKRKRRAIATLTRFCDTVVSFYLQSHKSALTNNLNHRTIEVSVSTPTLNTTNTTRDDSSTENSDDLSYSSASIPSESKPEMDLSYQNKSESKTCMEMYLMEIEDELSSQLCRLDQKRLRELQRKKLNIVNEITRRYESFCMAREDRYSNALQKEELENMGRQIFLLQKQKMTYSEQNVKELVKKEADQIMKAKVRLKPKKTNATNKIKPITKEKRDHSSHLYAHKSIRNLDSKENIEHLSVPNLMSNEYTKRLLRRRESRLLRQEQTRIEMEEQRKKLNEQNKLKQCLILKRKNDRISEIITNYEKIATERKLDRELELMHMRQHLNTSEDLADNEELNYSIRSVTDWFRELMYE